MSHLNTLQWEALNQALPQLALALNWDLRLYGLLTPHERAAAAMAKASRSPDSLPRCNSPPCASRNAPTPGSPQPT